MSRIVLAVFVLGAVACAADGGSSGDDATNDAPTGCDVFVSFDPMMAIAGPTTQIRATAVVTGAPGVLNYSWMVTHSGATIPHEVANPADGSSITFIAADAGPYSVIVSLSGTSSFCPTGQGTINVGVEGGNLAQIRMRVYPPTTIAAPPSERLVPVTGGADFSVGNVPIDPGIVASGHVRASAAGVPSYLRFIPAGAKDAFVESFTAADGKFDVRVLNQVHDVLVVPTVAGYAPRLIEDWMPGMAVLNVDAGTTITGVVRDPAGNGIANAKVQLALNGVPSTLATTNGTGNFSVLAKLPTGVPEVRVDVTPLMTSGYPRITGASTALVATAGITVQYVSALVPRDIGGSVVRRGGVAQANVPVKIVGTISAVARITATGMMMANGEVRVATVTNGSGAIPSGTLAPNAPLSAVALIGSQYSVDAFDLSTTVPPTIDAPAPIQVDTQTRTAAQQPLPNAVIELQPTGALALAGAPMIRGTSNSSAQLSLSVPVGGRFDVRAYDPLGRAAPSQFADIPTAMLSSTYDLKKALRVTGALVTSGNPQPVGRAAVQILCSLCTGVERSRPLAEGSSSAAGSFDIAVFDPGVAQ